MSREEERINLDDVDTDIHENEYDDKNKKEDVNEIEYDIDEGEEEIKYEDDLDDLEEEEPRPLMIALVSLGVVIVLVIVISIVVLFLRSDEDTEEEFINTIETEQETFTEDRTADEHIEDETVTILPDEETESEEAVSNVEQKDESSKNITEDTEIPESSSAAEEASQSEEPVMQEEPVSGNESMEFTEINDTVTAKDVTNLRSVPSTLDEENVVSQLLNGEAVSRTGINDATGWSRLEYNGQIMYAVSNYLTTDLEYKPPVAPSDPNRVATQDGRVIIFTDYDDYVTPKEYVNLRVEPSTSEGEATVRCQINNGDTVHRTGYSPDSGWSRVEYNGEILYVVSSMIYSTEAVTE